MKNFWLGFLLCIFLTGCGQPTVYELNKNVKEAGTAITNKSWSKAEEETRKFLDNWMYIRSNYSHKDRKKLERLTENLEMSLAVSNSKKASEDWKKLKHQWDLMND